MPTNRRRSDKSGGRVILLKTGKNVSSTSKPFEGEKFLLLMCFFGNAVLIFSSTIVFVFFFIFPFLYPLSFPKSPLTGQVFGELQ